MRQSTLRKHIEMADMAKKSNRLDLSSDQDLTVGLMNLLSIEEYIKLHTTNDYAGLLDMVVGIRMRLMERIVNSSDKNKDTMERLLTESMSCIDDGVHLLSSGDNDTAYALFDDAYAKYSLFWGLNMGLIDKKDIES